MLLFVLDLFLEDNFGPKFPGVKLAINNSWELGSSCSSYVACLETSWTLLLFILRIINPDTCSFRVPTLPPLPLEGRKFGGHSFPSGDLQIFWCGIWTDRSPNILSHPTRS